MIEELHETDSPFHPGEQQAQERAGVRDKLEKIGRKHIRDYLPDQHREFYAELPFVLLGSVDDQGRPWASIVAGQPGFMSSPDPQSLEIAAHLPPGAPAKVSLGPGSDVGLLGLQLETRRRNRLSGHIRSAGPDGIAIEVGQTFGNCPKYIQTRTVEALSEAAPAPRPAVTTDRFDDATRSLIERSDTLFIATAYLDGPNTAARGTDVSHRGGKPGFVRVEDDRTFVFPDFSGNLHFNTIGNIISNPKAGFLFVDFDTGDLVYTTGHAEIVWDSDQIAAFDGAERLIRFRAHTVVRAEASLPLRFKFGEYSPYLERTGNWEIVS